MPPPSVVDPIDELLTAHGLRRTSAARLVLGCLLAHPDIDRYQLDVER